MSRAKVLAVDDDRGQRTLIRDFLLSRGYEASEAADAEQTILQFRSEHPDVVLLDYLLPGSDGLNLLGRLRELDPTVPVVMITGHGDVELAVEAIRAGAENFVLKPISLTALDTVLERALDRSRANRRQRAGRLAADRRRLSPFLGRSASLRALADEARIAAGAESAILMVGETGTGKGVLAHWLHEHGARAEESFVDINCAGFSRELLESELFGFARGAFTGAIQAKTGLLETAHRGTLFLDEIGELDTTLQPKLLKVIEEKTFRRVGETQERRSDTRILAATNRNLAKAMEDGSFRRDLFYRVSTFVLELPPLRARKEDLPLLVDDLLERLGEELGRRTTIAAAAFDELASYDWPGNIRELRNVLERAVLRTREPMLTSSDLRFAAALPARAQGASGGDGPISTLAESEREALQRRLARARGNVGVAADLLGVPRSTLYGRLKEQGLKPHDFREPPER